MPSCAPPIPDGGFGAPDPASRLYALVELIRTYRGPEATSSGTPPRHLLEPVVAMLASDDPASRFMAMEALRSLTGVAMGFDPAAPVAERAPAIQKWKQWVEALPA